VQIYFISKRVAGQQNENWWQEWSANLFCLGDRRLGQIVNENSSACP
jgi:hypothetical protein